MTSPLDRAFELLFKYRPYLFEKGRLILAAPRPLLLIALAVAAVALPMVLSYGRAPLRARDRAVLVGLRLGALGLLLVSLCRPVLLLSTVVPQQSFVGVLVDDSRSMRLSDGHGQARHAYVERELARGGGLREALERRFKLRFFRFSSGAERVGEPSGLSFAGGHTDLVGALDRARAELAAVPLSGLVLLTDGADNAHGAISDAILALKARSVPVFTVGLGEERFARDVELTRVEAPRSTLKGAAVAVDLLVAQRGYPGRRVTLQVEDEGRVVSTQEVKLPDGDEPAPVRVHLTAAEGGPHTFRFRIAADAGESVSENNAQEAVVAVQDRREKLLYFEGEPRFELKFIRRAVAADPNIQVVVLQRTGRDKFLRLDVDDADELAGGFPKTRRELFRYRGLVLGSVEATFFTADQLRMMADFVSQRGGGLLMLGGRHSFAEGGYTPTPLADVLPVVLEPRPTSSDFFAEVAVERTPAGAAHAVLQVAPTPDEAQRRWRSLPPLTTVNPVRRVKPGASTLLTGRASGLPEPQVVLAHQRYGRGKALAFTVHDSWQWQMHADMAVEDPTHETLWRQLLRWLVSEVPDPVTVTTPSDRVEPAEAVPLTAEVYDETYLEVNDARVSARVKGPGGRTEELPLEWSVEKDGEYRGRFVPHEQGLYEVMVEARRGETRLGTGLAYVRAGEMPTEYFGAEMQASLLKRIAKETGGRFYTPETARSLAEDLSYTQSGATVVEEKDLWDMPAVFVLLVGLLGAEWVYRRARGLS